MTVRMLAMQGQKDENAYTHTQGQHKRGGAPGQIELH